MTRFLRLFHYEFLLIYRQWTEWLNPLFFFVLVVALFPLAISPEPALLLTIAPAIIWVSIALAVLLGLDNLFRADYEDGFLVLWCLSCWPLVWLILIRISCATLAILMPFFIALPVVAVFFQMPAYAVIILLVTTILAVPTLLLIGGLGVALTMTLSRGGILIGLLVLPLYIPVLIFATSAVNAALNGDALNAQIAFLSVFTILSVTFMPFLIAFCFRNAD